MKVVLIILCAVALIAGGVVYFVVQKGTAEVKVARDYNVLFISIDTLRADFLSCYRKGAAQTPNIDALSEKGVLLENFHSTINTTLAAHSSMFTGLYPRNHGVARNAIRLNSRNLTLAEYLSAHDYTTAAFIGSFALASVFGSNQGFGTYDETFIGNPQDYVAHSTKFFTKSGQALESVDTNQKTGGIMRSAEEVNRSFFQWLDQNKSKKFFAFVHYYDPHFPYYPPETWYKKHLDSVPSDIPLSEKDRQGIYGEFRSMIGSLSGFRPDQINDLNLHPTIKAMLQLYLSEIEYSDFALGEIMKKLEKENLRSKTIVVFTSDHGENLVEHPEFNSFFRHGTLTHDTEIHVPFVISCPGTLPEDIRLKQVYSQVDIFPTLLELLGLKQPGRADGVSFFPNLSGKEKRSTRYIFAEASQPRQRDKKDTVNLIWLNNENSSSARSGEYKFTLIPWKNYEGLFRIPEDALEAENILDGNTDIARQMRKELNEWKDKALVGNIDQTFQLSDEDREKLESLGYVQ